MVTDNDLVRNVFTIRSFYFSISTKLLFKITDIENMMKSQKHMKYSSAFTFAILKSFLRYTHWIKLYFVWTQNRNKNTFNKLAYMFLKKHIDYYLIKLINNIAVFSDSIILLVWLRTILRSLFSKILISISPSIFCTYIGIIIYNVQCLTVEILINLRPKLSNIQTRPIWILWCWETFVKLSV